MRYRDTRGDDDLVGTSFRDVFTVRHGIDTVDGGDGRDTLLVDYSAGRWVGYSPDRLLVDAAGAISGEIHGGDRSVVTFHNVERLGVASADTRHLLTVQMLGDAAAGALHWRASGSADALDLYWQTGASANITTLGDGTLSTGSAEFSGFERVALYLGEQADVAFCGDRADYVYGRGGTDYLSGGGGDDFLYGGRGADVLIGGAGADLFYYFAPSDSRPSAPDQIYGFSHAEGDRIDLSRIDANPDFERNQSFTFIDGRAFTGAGGNAGEVRQTVTDGIVTLEGDRNHDAVADFVIVIHTDAALVATDLIL